MELTTDEVTQVLRKKYRDGDDVDPKKTTKFELKTWEVKPVAVSGLMGTYYNLFTTIILELDDGTQEQKSDQFFLKRQSANLGLLTTAQNVFDKEAATYRLLMEMDYPILNNIIPKCYLANKNSMVFGDLSLEGYTQQYVFGEPSMEEVQMMMKTLAALHASSIIYEEEKSREKGRQYSLIEDFPDAFMEYYCSPLNKITPGYVDAMVKGMETLADMYRMPKYLKNGKVFKDELNKLHLGVKHVQQDSGKYRRVLCHCDLWAANFFVLRQEEDRDLSSSALINMKLIDFQMTRYKPPAHDLISMLYLHVTREFRKKHYYDLVKDYYNYLKAFLNQYEIDVNKVCKYADFLDSCEEEKVLGIFNQCNTLPLVLLPKDDLAHFLDSEDKMKFYLEDRSPIFQLYRRNAFYDLRITDLLLDFKEYLENDG